MALRIESVRARLTLFYVTVLALVLVVVGGLIYVLLARALYTRIDENLLGLVRIAMTSLRNDLAEGQDALDAARSTADELSSRGQMLAIYDWDGQLLAESGRDDDVQIVLPAVDAVPLDEPSLSTIAEEKDADDRHRLALLRVAFDSHDARYVVVAGSTLEPTDEELEALRDTLAYVVPIALVLAGLGGWFLAQRSLAPVVAMAERARRLGGEDLSGRLPVANPRDELGRLAATFNELLARLEAAMVQQRRFMADASHELRTPVATTRTAATVTLQQPHRDERDYRDALDIIERQAARLSRVVEDMFTLARADAGNYPVRMDPMYLDEVVDDVVRAARVIADTKGVAVEATIEGSASFTGDEDLVRRMVGNLVDNAVRHAPSGSKVDVVLARAADTYAISITDRGPGIPDAIRAHIFERFFRADASRARAASDGGAGLGLALARWIANVHRGDVRLVHSSPGGTTFTASLPCQAEPE
jgi:heavy metal sensor kinase